MGRITPRPKLEKSDSQLHYEGLIKFFKYLLTLTVGTIGVIVTAAGIFFYSNMGEVKNDIKNKVDAIAKSALTTINNSNDLVKGINDSATATINKSKKLVASSISSLRTEATKIARTETRNKVEEEFRSNKIVPIIVSTAREEMKTAVQNNFADLIAPKMDELMKLADASNKMRMGFRFALGELQKISISSDDLNMRKMAAETIMKITTDYDTIITRQLNDQMKESKMNYKEIFGLEKNASDSVLTKTIIERIENTNSLNIIAPGFIILRDYFKMNIKMFDFAAFDEWRKTKKIILSKPVPKTNTKEN